ncbi:MAG: protein kinase domain-containing protein [Terriglobales bacterium]
MPPPRDIGNYRIVSKLGEGGMGEVWRATDTRLNRDVAVKLLPAAFAEDPMRMARFAREAQLLASLNHPGIAAIYGVEQNALIMELVDGPTLAERIAQGAIPSEDVMPIALQIAEALEYAHEKGVIHRDLKPANIKVTPEGRVKILDFGLAKAVSSEAGATAAADAPTLSSPATLAGTILGTAAYMAPEQARGQNVDRRADIWAFGVVLYEMFTGERPFRGATVSDTLAGVLRAEPSLTALAPAPCVIVQGCLRKDVRERWQAIGDVRLALAGTLPAMPAPPTVRPAWRPPILLAIAGAVVVVLAVALAIAYFQPADLPAPVISFTIAPPANTQFVPAVPALSPDGRALIFTARGADGNAMLWLRRLDSATAKPLDGTAGASEVFWSPDSRSIGFWKDASLEKMDLNGGPPLRLADAPSMHGASWGANGVIVFAPNGFGPLYRIPAAGGTPVVTSVPDRSRADIADVWPWFLPDGRHFLYLQHPASVTGTISVGSLDSIVGHPLVDSTSSAVYASGKLLFERDNTLMAQPFDPARQALTGEVVPVAVVGHHTFTQGNFTASANGVLAYWPFRAAQASLGTYDRGGHLLASVGAPGQYLGLGLSPSGASAIVTEIDNQNKMDLWLYDLNRNVGSPFLLNLSMTMTGVWSPDGRLIAFSGARHGTAGDLYLESADDSGTPELLYSDNRFNVPTSWSPDGKYLLFESFDQAGVWVLPVTGDRKPRLLVNGHDGKFSPGGRWVAYVSDETGRSEIYLTPFPGPGPRVRVSTAGGTAPSWRGDGKELFYISPDKKLMAAAVDTAATPLRIGAVQPLFGLNFETVGNSGAYPPYAVTSDGQRFLAITTTGPTAEPPLTVVVNWPASLQHY